MDNAVGKQTNTLKEPWQILTLLCLAAVVMITVLAICVHEGNTYAAWCAERGGELSTYYYSAGCNIPE